MIKNNKGFTLIEMLIVLLVITVLIILTVPNITKHHNVINHKGCDAYIEVVQAQVELYKLEKGHEPTSISDLTNDYINSTTCPDGKTNLTLVNGRVQIKD